MFIFLIRVEVPYVLLREYFGYYPGRSSHFAPHNEIPFEHELNGHKSTESLNTVTSTITLRGRKSVLTINDGSGNRSAVLRLGKKSLVIKDQRLDPNATDVSVTDLPQLSNHLNVHLALLQEHVGRTVERLPYDGF